MKKIFKAIGHGFANFFKSIWEDFVNLILKHWLKLFGYVFMFVVPIIYLITTYIYHKPESWALPVFVWLPLIVFGIVYWFKIRTYLAVKVNSMKLENSLQKGKHAGFIILITVLQMAMTVAPFLLFYYVFDNLEKLMISIKDIFFILTIFEAIGSIFVIFDTIINVSKE